MKAKNIIIALLLTFSTLNIQAQSTRQQVESGIASVEQLIENHKWREAFELLRSVEAGAMDNAVNTYLTTKQRYRMYSRINKASEASDCMQRMVSLAMSSNDDKIIEDMLHTKAAYHAGKGEMKASRQCYTQMFNRRSAGKNDSLKELCFKQMIEEASTSHNNTMKAVVSDIYASWQDSISAVRASQELTDLKANYEAAQQAIDDKDTKIGLQWGTIIVLALLLAGVSIAAVVLLLIMMRNAKTIKGLRNSLELSNQNSAQKSIFMRNIGSQIAPSLNEIARGNSHEHIKALESMLSDVENFIELDDTKGELYETEDVNVADLCEQVAKDCGVSVPVTSDASRMSFPVCKDAAKQLLVNVIKEATLSNSAERVVIDFKKRNPHTGQFLVTVIGNKYSEEERQTLFTAFAKVYDLTTTTGLVLPICSIMAHKMGGSLSIDEQFAKGTRFVLEVHC